MSFIPTPPLPLAAMDKCRYIFCIMVLGVLPLMGFAQSAPTHSPQNQQLNQQLNQQIDDEEARRNRVLQEQIARDLQTKSPFVSLQEEVTVEPDEIPQETPCFVTKTVKIVFPESIPVEIAKRYQPEQWHSPFAFLADITAQYQQRCIGKEGLNHLLKRVNNTLITRGYSTSRMGLGTQNLASGVVVLTLIPGFIGQIRVKDDNLWGTVKNAFPSGAGELLNLRDLEQGLEQIKRLTYQEVDMEIVPTSEVGVSDVMLNIQRGKPWRVSLTLDDAGGRSMGKFQGGANLTWENVLGLSDMLTIGLNQDTRQRANQYGTRNNSITYQIPWGYWLFTLLANDNNYYQLITGNANEFTSSGRSASWEVKASWLFQRDQTQKNSLQVRTGARRSRSYIEDTEIEVQRRATSMVELAWIHKHYFGKAQLDLTLAHRQGVPWFDAQDDLVGVASTTTPGAGSPTFFYKIQTLDVSYTTPTIEGLAKYNSNFRLQHTNSDIYASEWFSIGNRYTVRGFDGEQTLSAENGAYWRNEVEFNLPWAGHTFFQGVDMGKVWGNNEQYLAGNFLTGLVVGWRGSLLKGHQFEIFVGMPLVTPTDLKTARPTIGFSTSYQF